MQTKFLKFPKIFSRESGKNKKELQNISRI